MIKNLVKKNKIFVIAEIGNNHEGNFDVAKLLIEKAAEAGVDAVKFQTIQPKYLVNSDDRERLNKLESFKFEYEQFQKLSLIANDHGLIFFSTPFDIDSALKLNDFQNLFKIASGDNNFYPLIKTISSFKKPTFLSTGLTTIDDLKKIVEIWTENGDINCLSFLHCVSSYPVPEQEANLNYITKLKKHFPNIFIGYSDHTIGIDASLYAVILGAQIIEKHFTIDKNFSDFRDHQISSDPKEMKELVDKINNIFNYIGKDISEIQECEKSSLISSRRSIAAKFNLEKNKILTYEDLTWVRPGTGFFPGDEDKLIGKKIKYNIAQGQIFKKEDFF